jgi:hypothetical protein
MIGDSEMGSGAASAAPEVAPGTGSNGDAGSKYPKPPTKPMLVMAMLRQRPAGITKADVFSFCDDLPSAIRTLRKRGESIRTVRGHPSIWLLDRQQGRGLTND